MDVKLAEYRAKKKRKELIDKSKEKLYSLFNRQTKTKNDMDEECIKVKEEDVDAGGIDDGISITSEVDSLTDESPICDELTYSKFSLYASLWLILFSFAVYLEFGAVYFVISGFFIIWANTRTGPKKRGEISAYSVFNPDCEAIDGTLKPEQFEREIRYGVL